VFQLLDTDTAIQVPLASKSSITYYFTINLLKIVKTKNFKIIFLEQNKIEEF